MRWEWHMLMLSSVQGAIYMLSTGCSFPESLDGFSTFPWWHLLRHVFVFVVVVDLFSLFSQFELQGLILCTMYAFCVFILVYLLCILYFEWSQVISDASRSVMMGVFPFGSGSLVLYRKNYNSMFIVHCAFFYKLSLMSKLLCLVDLTVLSSFAEPFSTAVACTFVGLTSWYSSVCT